MAGNCANCKHWSGWQEDWNNTPRPYGKCGQIMHGQWEYEYQEDKWSDLKPEPESVELAYTMDGSDYKSCLNTHADFGCVLFEAKDTPVLYTQDHREA